MKNLIKYQQYDYLSFVQMHVCFDVNITNVPLYIAYKVVHSGPIKTIFRENI